MRNIATAAFLSCIATAAFLSCIATVAFGDSITIDGVKHEDVYVREGATRYFVQIPSAGRTISVQKDKVAADDVSISGDTEHRQALLEEWQRHNVARGEADEQDPQERQRVLELLDRYAATQDKIYKSYHVKFDSKLEYARSDGSHETVYCAHEIKFDGRRLHMSRKTWGDCDLETPIPESDAEESNWLWDGQTHFQYGYGFRQYWKNHGSESQIRNSYGAMHVFRECPDRMKSGKTTGKGGFHIRGYFGSYEQRIDELLRASRTLRLRDGTERMGGADCYVIDAVAPSGTYTVWIDPEHGYNLAKVLVDKGGGDLNWERPLPDGARVHFSMRDVEFKEVQGVWVPMAFTGETRLDYPNGDWLTCVDQYRRTLMELEPVFGVGAFLPVCPEGSMVYVDWIHGQDTMVWKTKYTWKNGQVLNDKGQVVKLTSGE